MTRRCRPDITDRACPRRPPSRRVSCAAPCRAPARPLPLLSSGGAAGSTVALPRCTMLLCVSPHTALESGAGRLELRSISTRGGRRQMAPSGLALGAPQRTAKLVVRGLRSHAAPSRPPRRCFYEQREGRSDRPQPSSWGRGPCASPSYPGTPARRAPASTPSPPPFASSRGNRLGLGAEKTMPGLPQCAHEIRVASPTENPYRINPCAPLCLLLLR